MSERATPGPAKTEPPLRGWDISAWLFAFGARLLVGALALGRVRVEGLDALRSDPRIAGSLVVVLLWVYYSAQILFFGAELTKVYADQYGSNLASKAAENQPAARSGQPIVAHAGR